MTETLRIDLHLHSNASDGFHPPADLVGIARERGVRLIALTDHDTVGGVVEAAAAAEAAGIAFVPGVEVSSRWNDTTIHVVGLGVDCAFAEREGLFEGSGEKRASRGAKMAERFDELGMPGSYEGAMAWAKSIETLSRNHFAHWLRQAGYVKSVQEAFDRYVGEGCPAYVSTAWPGVDEAVAAIKSAGGVAVLAHPGRYRMGNGAKLADLIDFFEAGGGLGIEVCSGSQDDSIEPFLARQVRERGLWASLGSDFHSLHGSRPFPGGIHSLPSGLEPVWRHVPGLSRDDFKRAGIADLW